MKKLTALGVALVLSTATVLVATSTTAESSAELKAICHWSDAQYPHVSWHNERFHNTLDIKTAASGHCDGSLDPIYITAQMVLEKEELGGLLWVSVPGGSGPAVTKDLQGGPQVWTPQELYAVTPCVDGTYRAILYREVNGDADAIDGPEIISPPTPIVCKFRHASMVIDDTGSMGNVIGSVSSSLTSFIQSRPEDEAARWSLTTLRTARPTSAPPTTETRRSGG